MTSRWSALAPAVVVAAALIAAAGGLTRPLPVFATFGPTAVEVGVVSLSTAVAVLSAFMVAVRVGPAGWRAAERSQVAGVSVFLVAQLNGITEVTALVPLYAIAAGSTLMLDLVDRGRADGRSGRRAFVVGAAVGIVPWGVIAFQQIGSLLVGAGPDPSVRAVTLLVLALAAAQWATVWRRAGRVELLLSSLIPAALLLAAVLPAP